MGVKIFIILKILKYIIGYSIVIFEGFKFIKIMEEVGMYFGKLVSKCLMMYCLFDGNKFCKVCVGFNLVVNFFVVFMVVVEYGLVFLFLFMKVMYGKILSIVCFNV